MHVAELDTPAVVVDLNVLEGNLREMSSYCADHGLGLRPHIKTHKIPEIARMQVRLGACGITVAKLGEAEIMARAGLDDILVAYPIVGAAKLARLVDLARRARLAVAADSIEAVQGIADAARNAGVRVGLLAELDAGFGRCGVQTPAELVGLAQRMARLPNADFLGFLFYPGHIRVPPDQQDAELLRIDARLQEAQDGLHRSGIEVRVVSGGSTPTARRSHVMKTLTEIRPGTYVFNDMNTAAIGACDVSQCAVAVHVTVVSVAVPGRAVVDGGSKTFSSDPRCAGAKPGFGFCPEHPEIVLESMTEEHGHLNVAACARPLRVGERLRFIPNHVCTTINMHSEVWGARGERVIEHWNVAGRGLVR